MPQSHFHQKGKVHIVLTKFLSCDDAVSSIWLTDMPFMAESLFKKVFMLKTKIHNLVQR